MRRRARRTSPKAAGPVRRKTSPADHASDAGSGEDLREARLRGLSRRVDEIELILRLDGRIVEANDRAVNAYGLSREELLRSNIRDLRAPSTLPLVPSQMAQALAHGTRFETEHIRRDGRTFPVEVSSCSFTAGGEVYLHSLVRDLTETRRAENHRLVLDRLVRSMTDAVLVTDRELRVTEYAGAAERIYGWSREEVVGKRLLTDLFREFPDGNQVEVAERLAAGEEIRARLRALRKDGGWADLDLSVTPLQGPDSRVAGWLSVARDIGPMLAAEREVRESRERLSIAQLAFVLDGADDGSWDWHILSGRVAYSPRWASMLGYDPQELAPSIETWQRLTHPDDHQAVMEAVHAHLRGETEQYRSEHRLRHKDGRWVWVLDRGRVVERDEAGGPVRAAGTHMDITERRHMEGALRAREELFRTLAENTPDLVVRYDCHRRCHYLNPAATALIGRPAAEVLGRTGAEMDRSVPLVGSLDRELAELLRTGRPMTAEKVHPGPGGERAFECRLAPERNRRGQIGSILAVCREVTDRRRQQEQLRALGARIDTVREEEQTRIARDLHDVMGQLLTALKLRLERIERAVDKLGDGDRIRALLDQVVSATELADASQTAVRELAQSLRSPILDDLGLYDAIRAELRGFEARTGMPCTTCIPETPLSLAPERATAVYRILQEALTNVARHARAQHVEVAVEDLTGWLVLRVDDDGIGIRSSPGAGGVGITGMRERAERLGGELHVEQRRTGGTRVLARIPLLEPLA